MEEDTLSEIFATYPAYSDVATPVTAAPSNVYSDPTDWLSSGTSSVTTDSGSTNWGSIASDVSSVGGGIGSILGGIGKLFAGENSTPTAGSYNAAGQFVPLRNSAGVLSVPGQTTVLGQTATGSNVIGSTVSNLFGSISPYLPYLLLGAGVIFLFKLLKK